MSDKTIAVFADTAEAYEELCSGVLKYVCSGYGYVT